MNSLENTAQRGASISKLPPLLQLTLPRTCKVWDVRTGECITTLLGAYDEVLDINFNSTGTKIVTASADGNARIYNVYTGACIAKLSGHDGEISRCHFNP